MSKLEVRPNNSNDVRESACNQLVVTFVFFQPYLILWNINVFITNSYKMLQLLVWGWFCGENIHLPSKGPALTLDFTPFMSTLVQEVFRCILQLVWSDYLSGVLAE